MYWVAHGLFVMKGGVMHSCVWVLLYALLIVHNDYKIVIGDKASVFLCGIDILVLLCKP